MLSILWKRSTELSLLPKPKQCIGRGFSANHINGKNRSKNVGEPEENSEARRREFFALKSQDPVWLAKHKEMRHKQRAEQKAQRLAEGKRDLEDLEKKNPKPRIWVVENKQDPELRRRNTTEATNRLRRKQNAHYTGVNARNMQNHIACRTWCHTQLWVRQLPWKTHVPMKYPKRVERFCSGCDFTRPGGLRLWWRKIDGDENIDTTDPEDGSDKEYLCPSCYAKGGWGPDSMPQGYEDVTTYQELVARKKKLDGIDPKYLPRR